MIDFEYDERNIWGLVSALSMRDRVRVFKNAMRRSANEIKKRAGDILLSRLTVSKPSVMRKGVWTKVYDRTAGFRVAVAGNKHCYPSHTRTIHGVRELPLARWYETGTEHRSTRYKGYARGALQPIGFLKQAVEELEPGINDRIEDNFFEYMMKEARKYGCV